MTDRTKISRGNRLRGALLAAALLSLLLPVSALADPPSTTIETGPADGSTINDPTPTFTFSSPDGTAFECRVDGGPDSFGPCSGPDSHTTEELTEGSHTFAVRAVLLLIPDDTPATSTFTVDITAPETTINSGPSGLTANNDPSFGFSSDEAGSSFECRLDGPGSATEAFASCTSPRSFTNLADGDYTLRVRATDEVSNTDPTPATRSFTVDTTAPQTTINSGPSGLTADNDPTFAFSSEAGASFECRLDGPGPATGTFDPCTSSRSYTNLADGNYTFRVRASDEVSNTDPNPATRSFTVDATPPKTTIDTGPTGTTADTTPTFTFSSDEPGSTFQCRIDSGPFGACSGPGASHTTPALADGFHTFAVRAIDPASNVEDSAASQAFEVDSSLPPDITPPDLKITKRPKGKIKTKKKAAKVAVSFSSEPGATFRCKLDRGEYKPCTSPYRVKARAGAGKGKKHKISVRAADEAGNIGKPAVIGFKVLRKLTLRAPVAHRTVLTALKRHDYARRVVRSVDVDCSRRSRIVFACKFSTRFSGYRLKGKGKVKLGNDLSYRFRVIAQGVHFTLTDENERPKR